MTDHDFIQASSLWELFEKRLALSAAQPFLIEAASNRVVTYQQFGAQVERRAFWLAQKGIVADSVVAWMMPTGIDAVVLLLALSKLGAIQAPVIHLYRQREIADILSQAQPSFFLVFSEPNGFDYLQLANDAIANIDAQQTTAVMALDAVSDATSTKWPAPHSANQVRWYYFTSGTTAKPKGARHSDESIMAAASFLGRTLELMADDVGSIGYPIAHIGGVIYCAMCMMAGMSVVLLDRYVPAQVVNKFRQYGVTLGGGSTAHYQMLLAEKDQASDEPLIPSMKILSGGGAAKPAALFHQVKEQLGAKIIHAYGMTEAPISSSNTPRDSDDQLANTDGVLMPGLEIRIINDSGEVLSAGECGEIILRGPNLCQGYLDEEQTRAAFDAEGFYHSGDVGMLREDGHLCVTGRLKDIIIRKGENISAREIEDLLLQHPKVRDVAVIGLPDSERGELVCAVIEPLDQSDALRFSEMVEFLSAKQLMRQKIPERLEVLARLPRNQSLQKVQKNLLKEQLLGPGDAAS